MTWSFFAALLPKKCIVGQKFAKAQRKRLAQRFVYLRQGQVLLYSKSEGTAVKIPTSLVQRELKKMHATYCSILGLM